MTIPLFEGADVEDDDLFLFHGWHALTLAAAAMGADLPLSTPLTMPTRTGGSICLYLEPSVLGELFRLYKDLREDPVYASLRKKILEALSGRGSPLDVISRRASPDHFPPLDDAIPLTVDVP